MKDFTKVCMVCQQPVSADCQRNSQLNLPVCDKCCDTEREQEAVKNLLDGMADGFVCGCI